MSDTSADPPSAQPLHGSSYTQYTTPHMVRFLPDESLDRFQKVMHEIYGMPDDRFFSVSDLVANEERFTMRALKGIRKSDPSKIKENLLISLSWHTAVANRLHINLEEALWYRFPGVCSYCGSVPCSCKATKPTERPQLNRRAKKRPGSLAEFQETFRSIYPPHNRTLSDAGVHLAEEMGEVSEAVHYFLGGHTQKKFEEVELELADWMSCFFGVANSAQIEIAHELAQMFTNGCHVCHTSPCSCSFSFVAEFKS